LFAEKLKGQDMTIMVDIPGAYRPDLAAADVDGGCQLPSPGTDERCRESSILEVPVKDPGRALFKASVSSPRVISGTTYITASVETAGVVATCTVEWPDEVFSLRLWGVAVDLALAGAVLQAPRIEDGGFSDQQDQYWSVRSRRTLGRAGALDTSHDVAFGKSFREYSTNLVRVQNQLSKDNGWWRFSKGQCGALP
jgi:hypothetical protein